MSKMPSHLKRRAWDIAAQWVDAGCDAFELPEDLTDEEEDMIRGYMRSAITKDMRVKGSAPLGGIRIGPKSKPPEAEATATHDPERGDFGGGDDEPPAQMHRNGQRGPERMPVVGGAACVVCGAVVPAWIVSDRGRLCATCGPKGAPSESRATAERAAGEACRACGGPIDGSRCDENCHGSGR